MTWMKPYRSRQEIADALLFNGFARNAGFAGAAAAYLFAPACIGAASGKSITETIPLPVYAGMALMALPVAAFLAASVQNTLRKNRGDMAEPRIRRRSIEPYRHCTGRTSTGRDAVIFVSDYWNPEEDESQEDAFQHHKSQGEMLQRYLKRRHRFDGYPVDGVHLVLSAKKADVRDAFMDPAISSVAFIGHSRTGLWAASGKNVTWQDVAGYVAKGHCKDGFGLKTGCGIGNAMYHFLAPAYSHPGHEGSLYVMQSPDGHSSGMGVYSRLERLVPNHAA